MSILLDVKPFDRGLWLGNSKTQGDNYGSAGPNVPKWHYVLAKAFRAAYANNGVDVGCPVMVTSGVAGDTVGDIITGIAGRCYQWCPDWVVVEVTTNDCSNPTPNATYTTNLSTLLTDIQTPANYPTGKAPRWILFVGPNMIGENWPNGANPFDTTATGIDAKAAIYGPICAGLGVVSWNPRAAVLQWEAANNPGHAGSGLLATALDGGTGKHETTLGSQAMAGWMLNNVFQGVPAGLPQFPLFTLVTS
jgi:lysophospholipase L1-like esterase